MKRKNLLVVALVLGIFAGSAGYMHYNAEAKESGKITVLNDVEKIEAAKIAEARIYTYDGFIGCAFIDEKKIIATKENNEIEPIKIDTNQLKADFAIKNLFIYDLETSKEKAMGNSMEFQDGALISPSQKYVFYRNEMTGSPKGYISDTDGKLVAEIAGKDFDDYDFFNAQWTADEKLILPCHSLKGFAIADLDGKIEMFKDVEDGVMGTQDPLSGLSMTNPVKVGDKIYYVTIHNGSDDDQMLKMYDIKTKKLKVIAEDKAVNQIGLSPDGKRLLVSGFDKKSDDGGLFTINLDGSQGDTLIKENYFYGESWSPDGKKVAYICCDENRAGVYLVDVETKEITLAAAGTYYGKTVWSPDSDKLMVMSKKPVDNKKPFPNEIDVTNVICFE